jgi:1-acyl-sn-glycerol-3-phosphate acyltransferase
MVGPFDGPWYNLAHRVVRLLVSALHRLRVVDGWRMPGDGGVLLVSNHTTGLDPVLIQVAVRRPVRFLMGTENMVWLLGWMWRIVKPIPVKPDRRDASAAKAAVGNLRRGQVVGIFPEGGFGDGGGQMKPFFRGVAMIARRSGAVIQPVWVTGPRNMKGVWRPLLTPSRSEIRFGEPFTLESMEQTHASRGRADEAVEVSDTASFAELDARLTQHIRDQLEALRRQSAGSTCHGSAVEPTDSDRSGATA